MANRTRKIVLRVPVTPEERELIKQKMALLLCPKSAVSTFSKGG